MRRPSFVVILSDDQAACDLGCLGATDLRTPHFDRLADAVFLADIEADPGETQDLAEERPDLVRELRAAAESWRGGIEDRWDREWKPRLEAVGATGYE